MTKKLFADGDADTLIKAANAQLGVLCLLFSEMGNNQIEYITGDEMYFTLQSIRDNLDGALAADRATDRA